MPKLTSKNIRESVYPSAIRGAVAWTVYAIIECGFSSILRWMITPGYEYVPVHWGFTALLFILYPVMGLLLGGVGGFIYQEGKSRIKILDRVQPEIFFSAWALFTVVATYVINFIVNYFESLGLSEVPLLFISLLLIFALVLSIRSCAWFNRLRFLANPWTASIVLIGLPWINGEILSNSSLVLKAATALVYPVVVFMISLFIQKIGQTSRLNESMASVPGISIRPLLLLAPVVLVVFGISFFLKQEPLVVPQRLKSPSAASSRHNVLLIVMDTVRADHLSLYGYEKDTTPYLKKFAREATLYTRAIATSDMTLPSHASLFTGIYGSWHRAHYDAQTSREGRPLDDKFNTLAEILSGKGYLTMAAVANTAYLHHDFGLNQGFQHYDEREAVPLLGETKFYYIRQLIRQILTNFFPPPIFDQRYRRAEDINKEVFTCLDKMKKSGRPLFIFLNYMDAHEPYIPPSPFNTYYSGLQRSFTLSHYFQMQEDVMRLKRKVTAKEYRHLLSQYDGGIAYIDYHLKKLITRLKELRFYENTLIIITSDHGEVFGERALVGHASSVYQDQVYVPLIIKYPNVNKKNVVDEPVSVVDLMPTILEVFGYEIPDNIQGESLLKVDLGKPRIVFSESFPNPTFIKWHLRFNRFERAIFSEHYKFIGSTAGKRELYDLSKDPNENKNLYNPDDDVSKELEMKLNQWIASIESIDKESEKRFKLDRETIDRLKSLGYIK